MVSRGRFITLEGGEGTGKSTQLVLLAERLQASGIDVEVTREPGGTEGAEAIRTLLVSGAPDRWQAVSEALLVNAGRADHVARRIRPALVAGRWVVCDRFVDSTLAYQGAGGGISDSDLEVLHAFATDGLWPDLTFVLDAPLELTLPRARGRRLEDEGDAADCDGSAEHSRGGRFELHDENFHARVRQEFRELTEKWHERCRLVDAARTVDEIAGSIWDEVARCFRLGEAAH